MRVCTYTCPTVGRVTTSDAEGELYSSRFTTDDATFFSAMVGGASAERLRI